MTPKHVLIVDDDPMVLDVVAQALEAADFHVSKARRVSIARDVLARKVIDLIIADARIPGETGLGLAEKARELGVPFILMTGDPEWLAARGIGPRHYLAKPLKLRSLVELVHACL